MIAKTRAELPAEYGCLQCAANKPIDEMVLVHRRRTHDFMLRPRCKACHNKRERGARREWKNKYQRRWRKDNTELNDSYWRPKLVENRELNAARARKRIAKYHHAILIQGRLRRRLNMKVPLNEAVALLKRFGPCYPTRFGLTPWALRECERIRSSQRRLPKHRRDSLVTIRMMLYEDGEFIKPSRQKPPYQHSANTLRKWQALRKEMARAA